MAETYDVAFKSRLECDREVAAFRFERPAGYTFLPGQFMQLTVATREGVQSKRFSLSQAPADPFLEVTTRLSGSAFKDALEDLSTGDRVRVSSARGLSHLREGELAAVFLVGGVGITPARSILRDAVQRSTGLDAVVFFANRNDACVPYRADLDGMAEGSPSIRIVYAFEDPPAGWAGESGFITSEMVARHVDPEEPRRWFVSGPPPMVDAMSQVLDALSIPAAARSVESFTGY